MSEYLGNGHNVGSTFCVLEQLQQGLDRREIFVTPSDRWGDPRATLLQGQAWEAARSHVCRTLNLSATAAPELTKLAGHLDETYRKVAANLATNTAVELERVDGKDRLSLGRLDKLDGPPSLAALRDQVDVSRVRSCGTVRSIGINDMSTI